MYVSSVLRSNFIAHTVQHSRLLVDFDRVLPTNPVKQEQIFKLLTAVETILQNSIWYLYSFVQRVVLVQYQYGTTPAGNKNTVKYRSQ